MSESPESENVAQRALRRWAPAGSRLRLDQGWIPYHPDAGLGLALAGAFAGWMSFFSPQRGDEYVASAHRFLTHTHTHRTPHTPHRHLLQIDRYRATYSRMKKNARVNFVCGLMCMGAGWFRFSQDAAQQNIETQVSVGSGGTTEWLGT